MSKTYCPMPWVGLNILPGEIRPCCHWEGAPVPLDQVRADILAGKELPGCQQCYFAEKIGSPSKRLAAIEEYGIVDKVSTQYLEVSFDNVCNLKCRGCCSFSSHLWRSDEEEIYGKPFIDEKYIESNVDIDCSNLKQIDISGGEPLLSRSADKFIRQLTNISDINLGLVTNGYTEPSEVMFNAMRNAKNLYLTISVDGIGELNDYFRSGSKFETVLKNIAKFNTLCDSNHKITINTTVSIYNVTQLKEIEDYFKTHYPHFKVQHRMLQWPEPLAIQNMPDKLKDIVRPIVESFGPDYSDVLEAINLPSKDLYGHFLNYHRKLDSLRGETLPNKLLADYIANNNVVTDSVVFFKQQMRG